MTEAKIIVDATGGSPHEFSMKTKDNRLTSRAYRTRGDRAKLTSEEIQEGIDLRDYTGEEAPTIRADCAEGIRPCPYVRCQYNLYLEVQENEVNPTIRINFPLLEGPHEMGASCALDEAEKGGMILGEIGARLNITRERVRQLQARAFKKIEAKVRRDKRLQSVVEAWEWSVERGLPAPFDH